MPNKTLHRLPAAGRDGLQPPLISVVMGINVTYLWDFISKNPAKTLNSFGLFLDIVGAILIFKYGLPEPISREGHISLITEQEDEQEKKKAKTYDQRARMGLIFLILGFGFQLVSNFL